MTDRIEKQIEMKASISRVWRALTDHREFGAWFQVRLDGPFVPGGRSTGMITVEGYEHVQWNAFIREIEPEHTFSFEWHPYAIDPKVDYSKEPRTLVEFKLKSLPSGGTRLRVTESGFDKIPAHRRIEALEMNTGGWEAQIENIRAHVTHVEA